MKYMLLEKKIKSGATPESLVSQSNVEKLAYLLVSDDLCWQKINRKIDNDDLWRERALRDIHFKRKHSLEARVRRRIIRILFRSYRVTQDIRYFNEYLFFADCSKSKRKLYSEMSNMFFDNIKDDGTHHWLKKPQVTASVILRSSARGETNSPSVNTGVRVGLLGSPHFFQGIKSKLSELGLASDIFFIPHHSNRLVRFLYNNKLLFRTFLFLKKINIPYVDLSSEYRRGEVGAEISKRKLDIAFHKLGFIIKNDIIKSFPLGIINDHWGPLPEVRGRSSLEYTLIFGFPITVTTHFITKEVDEGEIIQFFDYSHLKDEVGSVAELKKVVRSGGADRAVTSIAVAISDKFQGVKNNVTDGFMFYSMHPRLVRYIDRVILGREGSKREL